VTCAESNGRRLPTTEMLEWWLTEWALHRGRVFVDIGANTGEWTRWLASRFERGHAIEPDPEALTSLRLDVPENVEIHPVAAWDSATTIHFSRFAATTHTSSYFVESGINTGPRVGWLELPCLPIDALEIEGPVDFLKCDTEGAELEVLSGAARLIERDRPSLLVEVHSIDNWLRLMRMLVGWEYLLTVVRHPDYLRYSHLWYSHCWLSCQPRERVPNRSPQLAEHV
jgi:FkbM family methyltransferase